MTDVPVGGMLSALCYCFNIKLSDLEQAASAGMQMEMVAMAGINCEENSQARMFYSSYVPLQKQSINSVGALLTANEKNWRLSPKTTKQ